MAASQKAHDWSPERGSIGSLSFLDTKRKNLTSSLLNFKFIRNSLMNWYSLSWYHLAAKITMGKKWVWVLEGFLWKHNWFLSGINTYQRRTGTSRRMEWLILWLSGQLPSSATAVFMQWNHEHLGHFCRNRWYSWSQWHGLLLSKTGQTTGYIICEAQCKMET